MSLAMEVDNSKSQLLELVNFFLKQHNGYDLIPISNRLVVLDSKLLLAKALAALVQNGEESAPLWESSAERYFGLFTYKCLADVVLYYYDNFTYEEAMEDIKQITLENLDDILCKQKSAIKIKLQNNPMESLHKVSRQLISSSSNSVSLVDIDPESKRDVIVANLTVYQILQFLAANIRERELMMTHTLEEMGIGTYSQLYTASMDTPVIDIITMFVNHDISVVPIINEYGVLINAFDRSDLPNLTKEGMLDNLEMPVEQAIECRPIDYSGVHTCNKDDNLWSILATIRKKVVQRLIVIDKDTKPIGVITLNDILRALIV